MEGGGKRKRVKGTLSGSQKGKGRKEMESKVSRIRLREWETGEG